jgi:hypothetical protein
MNPSFSGVLLEPLTLSLALPAGAKTFRATLYSSVVYTGMKYVSLFKKYQLGWALVAQAYNLSYLGGCETGRMEAFKCSLGKQFKRPPSPK